MKHLITGIKSHTVQMFGFEMTEIDEERVYTLDTADANRLIDRLFEQGFTGIGLTSGAMRYTSPTSQWAWTISHMWDPSSEG